MNRLIVAIDRKRGLAKNGGMPWNIPEDEQFFTDQTKTHGGHVLTGGETFRLAYKNKPLKGRHNYVLTHHTQPIEGAVVVNDLPTFLDEFKEDLWVSGGAAVFEQIMALGKADELYITHIDADFGCDRFFPDYKGYNLAEESPVKEQNGFKYKYAIYRKPT